MGKLVNFEIRLRWPCIFGTLEVYKTAKKFSKNDSSYGVGFPGFRYNIAGILYCHFFNLGKRNTVHRAVHISEGGKPVQLPICFRTHSTCAIISRE